MNRDFIIYEEETKNFIGTFNSTEENAMSRALKIIKERNKLRQQIGYNAYTKIFVKACYIPRMENCEFVLII